MHSPPPNPYPQSHYEEDEFSLAFAGIESHYFHHGGWLDTYGAGQLLEHASKLENIPCVIVQGRFDMVCPATSAIDLAARMPHAKLVIVHDAGHSATEPGIISALLDATDALKNV